MLAKLSAYCWQHEIDIIHTHKYKDNILVNLASLPRSIYRVRTVHGSPEPFFGQEDAKMRIYESIDDTINRWMVDRIIAVSADLSNKLARRFGSHKVTCIHNAIDIEELRVDQDVGALRRELKVSEQDFLIGTMGRLVPVKGLELLLVAARTIKSYKPHVKFVIAGDGPLKEPLRRLAEQYGLGESVLFLGHRSDSHDVLRAMDVFVLCSLHEGIPIVLLEALALARPVVATRVGGIPEVIEHDVSGMLVAPGDPEALAQHCIALMDDYRVAERLGEQGRKRVEEAFSARFMADQVADIYRTLVARRKRQ
jgi:glycosyltransferase involved in cell wall biosynthesis